MKKRLWFLVCMMAIVCFTALPVVAQDDTAIADTTDEEIAGTSDTATDEAQTVSTEVDTSEDDQDMATAANAPADPAEKVNLNRFKALRNEIQKLLKQRFFGKAEKKIEALKDIIKGSKINDERKKRLMASVERGEKVTLFSAQGQYQKAANAIRQAISHHELKGDTARLLKVQEKVATQKKWFETRVDFEKQLQKLLVTKQPLLKEKLVILQKMDSKRKLSAEELKKLQTELKQINGKLVAINKEIREAHRIFAVKRDGKIKAGVILSADQHRKLFPHLMKRMMARFQNYRLHKQIAKHLSNISENSEVTWKDLKANFAALQKLQDEVWSLRKRLDVLAGKTPLSAADLKAAEEIRRKLEKAMNASEKLMGKIEDAFVDQKTFGELSAAEKLEFVKFFRDVWSKDKEFESLKPSLEDLYNKLFDAPIVIDDPRPTEPIPGEPVKPEPAQIEGEGFIIQEGKVFLLRSGDKTYWPNNLPARYMVNKLEVKFGAELVLVKSANEDASVENKIGRINEEWWRKYPEITFTYINAPQLPDEPFDRNDQPATPTQVIEENLDNQNKPANLMNAF